MMQENIYDDDIQAHSNRIRQRDQDVKDIYDNVVLINEINKDLSVLTEQQGAILDNIESNMITVNEDVETGLLSLKKASKYQNSSRRWLCIILVLLMIIIAIILLAVLLPKK